MTEDDAFAFADLVGVCVVVEVGVVKTFVVVE
jgi:hypothetical protein